MAGFLPPVVFEIKAMANEAIAKFGQVDKELQKMGKDADIAGGKVSGIDKASKIATAGLLALGTAFVGFAAIGIKEAVEAEQVMAKLGQTMANAGVNTAENRKMVEELSESYIQLGFADEDAAAGFDVLLRATGDVTKSQDLMSLSADYARVKHTDMASAAATLAKAGQGNVKAFKEMGISLDETLPKSEAIAKAFDELKDKIGGQAQAYAKTFAGQMAIMKEEFNNTAETLGTALIPILTQAMQLIRDGVKFVKEHSTAFKIFGGILLTIVAALAAYNIAVKVQMALTKAWTVVTSVQKAVMAMMTGQQIALNTAMQLNPIGLVVAAVVALIAVFLVLWNKFEGFRKAVITVGKVGLTAFASIIPIIGDVGEAMLKFILTPMKTLLSGLSHLPGVGKYAKAGLDLLNKGLDGVSNFADKASAKAKTLAANLDKLNKPIKINFAGGGIPDIENATGGSGGKGGKGGKGGVSPEVKKANDAYMKIVKDLNEKVVEAKTKFDESMLKAQTDHDEKTAKLRIDAAAKIADLNEKALQKENQLLKDYNKRKEDIEKNYTKQKDALTKKKNEDLVKLEKDHFAKLADITQAGTEKLQRIVQDSMDRLRNAFAKGTEVNVADMFKGLADAGAQSAQGLLDALKTKLEASKNLAANAAKLQGLGFSQTFIEQVVGAGTETGNLLAKSLLEATPETISQLQATYNAMEQTTNNGLDQLASAMNSGGNLATAELNKAYAQAQKDMATFLNEENKAYTDAQAQIQKTFDENLAEIETTRLEALAEAKANYDEQLAETAKDLADAIAAVNKDLADGLAESAKDLADAQAEARKQLASDLAAIQKEFDDKLGKIKDAIASTIAAIAALKTAMASAGSTSVGSMYTPVTSKPSAFVGPIPVGTTRTDTGYTTNNYTTVVKAETNATPQSIANSVQYAFKYGQVVTLGAGTVTTGMSAARNGMNTVFE